MFYLIKKITKWEGKPIDSLIYGLNTHHFYTPLYT